MTHFGQADDSDDSDTSGLSGPSGLGAEYDTADSTGGDVCGGDGDGGDDTVVAATSPGQWSLDFFKLH